LNLALHRLGLARRAHDDGFRAKPAQFLVQIGDIREQDRIVTPARS